MQSLNGPAWAGLFLQVPIGIVRQFLQEAKEERRPFTPIEAYLDLVMLARGENVLPESGREDADHR